MPPKAKVTKTAIIERAMELVRQEGSAALNARSLAKALNCSTQPIFSNFDSMEEIRTEVIRQAEALYNQYIREGLESGQFPPFKASGMAYIRFAMEERELFKLLFMRDRSEEAQPGTTGEVEFLFDLIQKNVGISRENAKVFHLSMWVYVHGIATMVATGYLDWDWELISRMVTDQYEGTKMRYQKELNKE